MLRAASDTLGRLKRETAVEAVGGARPWGQAGEPGTTDEGEHADSIEADTGPVADPPFGYGSSFSRLQQLFAGSEKSIAVLAFAVLV